MPDQLPPDVQDQVRLRMATGHYATEDEVLRSALKALQRQEQDVIAVKQAIADLEAGDRGVPFDDFVNGFRRRHNIPDDA